MLASNNDGLYASPRAVVDLRMLQVDEEKLRNNLEYLRTPMSQLPPLEAAASSVDADTTESSQPPLIALSICSSATRNDDSSSVSSVSVDGDAWETRRSIFASYWDKKGGRPKPVANHPPIRVEVLKTDDDHSYEHLLETNETTARRRDSDSTIPRRRLWDNRYVSHHSEPVLSQCLPLPLRKSKSSSAVEPRRSCLRKGRFSSSGAEERRSSEATSVSFNDTVQVQFLKPVAENWASKGWSKYFMD